MVDLADLKYTITLYKPTITTNDEGGKEKAYVVNDLTYGMVEPVDQTRALQAGADALTSKDRITMRFTTGRAEITKDWEIGYMGKRANIIEIKHWGLQNREWITLTVTDKTDGQTL